MEEKKKTSGFGTAALVLGIIGFIFSFIPIINYVAIILGILAVAFSIVSLEKGKNTEMAIAGVATGVLAIMIPIVMYATASKALDGVSKGLDQVSDSINDMSGENTEDILKNTLEVTFGTFEIKKGDFLDSYQLNVTIKNKGSEQKSFAVKIEAVDDKGVRIDDDTVYIDHLNAGQSQNVTAFTLVGSDTAEKLKSAVFKVVNVSMY